MMSKSKPNSDQKNAVMSPISTISSMLSNKPPLLANTFKPFDQQKPVDPFKPRTDSIIETKRMLSNGGVRLVSTRRPITPREPRRELYGKVSLADRPPSAFSLRYLQLENRILPPIESPIRSNKPKNLTGSFSVNDVASNKLSKTIGLRSSNSLNDLQTKVNHELDTAGSVSNSLSQHKSAESENATVLSPMSNILEVDEQITMNDANDGSPSKVQEQKTKEQLLLMRGNDLLAQSSTETLLEMLISHTGIKECSEETASHINGILTELYARVKNVKDDRRSTILSALYGLVECNSAKILLSVARVVLALGVTGSNLTGACKLVFKVARNERNDNLFANIDVPELLIDGLGRASPIEDSEACIYGYGSVRFLANAVISPTVSAGRRPDTSGSAKKHKSLAYRLIQHGAIPLITLHLQIINATGASSKLNSSSLHALYQLIGALRVISKIFLSDPDLLEISSSNSNNNRQLSATSISSTAAKYFVDDSSPTEPTDDFYTQIMFAGPHLIRAAEICITEIEVQSNIIRTLSILSEHDKCCETIADMSPRLGILLGTIFDARLRFEDKKSADNPNKDKALGVLNRIGYILGNIMAKCDSARYCFYSNDVAIEYLVKCLEFYANDMNILKRERRSSKAKIVKEDAANGDDMSDQHSDTSVDVVIKLTRVIANASVNADVGYNLANFPQLGTILLNVLETVNKFKTNFISELDELLLASLGAVHNLSFYQDSMENQKPNKGSMIEQTAQISASLCRIYQWAPDTIRSEIARVLGNLTRSADARTAVYSAGGLQFLMKNLSSNDLDMVATSCGILVNMLSDRDRRSPFRKQKGPRLLRIVLEQSASRQDWLLALIACQALWNYTIDSTNVHYDLGDDEANHLSCDILEYLDEEHLFENGPPDAEWEEFAVVAADLLERIQSSLSCRHSPYSSMFEEP